MEALRPAGPATEDRRRAAPLCPAGSGFKLGTSIIVGFPSETIEEVAETIEYCRQMGFDWVWCHSFSARPETPAANRTMQIGADEIRRRARWSKKQRKAQSLVTNAEDSAGSRSCQG
jgi:tRNA A37 methylthiotransferase MiaB